MQDGVHLPPAGGAGESFSRGSLSRCLRPRDARHEDRAARGQDTGETVITSYHQLSADSQTAAKGRSGGFVQTEVLLFSVDSKSIRRNIKEEENSNNALEEVFLSMRVRDLLRVFK